MQNNITQVMPNIDSEELEYITESIEDKWLTEGPKSQQFIEHIKKFTGSKYAVLAPNGTLGLFLGLLALDLPKGSEVIIPNFTFFASASSVVFAGLKPIFVDVDQNTFNMNASEVEVLITDNTSAIMPVHIYGHSVNMDQVVDIAKKYNLKVIEDAAQAYGVSYKGQHCGTFGDVSMISFFADKTITMGEGAAVLTQDEGLYKKLLLLRNQGRVNSGTFIHSSLGMNFRVTDLQCGVGLAQAEKFPMVLQKKIENYQYYYELLDGVGDLSFLKIEKHSSFVPFRFYVCTKYKKELSKFLEERGVQVRSFFYPMNRQPPLQKYNASGQEFANSDKLYDTGICLPLHYYLTRDDIRVIAYNIEKFFNTK